MRLEHPGGATCLRSHLNHTALIHPGGCRFAEPWNFEEHPEHLTLKINGDIKKVAISVEIQDIEAAVKLLQSVVQGVVVRSCLTGRLRPRLRSICVESIKLGENSKIELVDEETGEHAKQLFGNGTSVEGSGNSGESNALLIRQRLVVEDVMIRIEDKLVGARHLHEKALDKVRQERAKRMMFKQRSSDEKAEKEVAELEARRLQEEERLRRKEVKAAAAAVLKPPTPPRKRRISLTELMKGVQLQSASVVEGWMNCSSSASRSEPSSSTGPARPGLESAMLATKQPPKQLYPPVQSGENVSRMAQALQPLPAGVALVSTVAPRLGRPAGGSQSARSAGGRDGSMSGARPLRGATTSRRTVRTVAGGFKVPLQSAGGGGNSRLFRSAEYIGDGEYAQPNSAASQQQQQQFAPGLSWVRQSEAAAAEAMMAAQTAELEFEAVRTGYGPTTSRYAGSLRQLSLDPSRLRTSMFLSDPGPPRLPHQLVVAAAARGALLPAVTPRRNTHPACHKPIGVRPGRSGRRRRQPCRHPAGGLAPPTLPPSSGRTCSANLAAIQREDLLRQPCRHPAGGLAPTDLRGAAADRWRWRRTDRTACEAWPGGQPADP